ncbi:MAG: hypothetical protein RBS48_09270, partial [Ignavibacteriaceae bacterium]|nr:hypothetical protein [Ignavibacteriaceae bacterium]
DGNFDRVSAMSAVMILREDRYKRTESLKETGGVKTKDLSTDTFFNKNYTKNRNAIDDGIV